MCLDEASGWAHAWSSNHVFMPLRALDVFGPVCSFSGGATWGGVFMPLRALDVFGRNPLANAALAVPFPSSCP